MSENEEQEKEALYTCPVCDGDGKETCTNPDHGFISMMGFHDIGRLGCPGCGHDEYHKVPNGGSCECCNGLGEVDLETCEKILDEYGIDSPPEDFKLNNQS